MESGIEEFEAPNNICTAPHETPTNSTTTSQSHGTHASAAAAALSVSSPSLFPFPRHLLLSPYRRRSPVSVRTRRCSPSTAVEARNTRATNCGASEPLALLEGSRLAHLPAPPDGSHVHRPSHQATRTAALSPETLAAGL